MRNLLGIVGVILGIPGYAILKVLVSHLFLLFKRRYNKYYGDDSGEYEIKKKKLKNVLKSINSKRVLSVKASLSSFLSFSYLAGMR